MKTIYTLSLCRVLRNGSTRVVRSIRLHCTLDYANLIAARMLFAFPFPLVRLEVGKEESNEIVSTVFSNREVTQ